MLFKFKSKVTGDVIMLDPNGRRVLQVIGKDPGPKGIIEPAQMAGAIAALEAAIAQEEAEQKAGSAKSDAISLRQRALPFIDMLRQSQKADEPVTWGV